MFIEHFEKTASGDMIEYFNQNPKKYEEWKARRAAKLKKKMEKKGSAANVVRGLEHAGLMALQAPSWSDIKKTWGKKDKKSRTEKWKAGAEIAGLTALQGAVEAAHTGSSFNKLLSKNKIKNVITKIKKVRR